MSAFCPICGSDLDTEYKCANAWMHELWQSESSPADAFEVNCPRCGGAGVQQRTEYESEFNVAIWYPTQLACNYCSGKGIVKVRIVNG